MTRFIVTGGLGFIGGNLIEALNRRGCSEIVIVDNLNHPEKRQKLETLRFSKYIDKHNFRAMLRSNDAPDADIMIHLGANSSTTATDEAQLRENNYHYTRDLCEWCVRGGRRFVYASSAATYGDGSLGFSDSHDVAMQLQPLNLYGWSKQWFDTWAIESGAINQIVGLKFFNVYGRGDSHKWGMQSAVAKWHDDILHDRSVLVFELPEQNVEQSRDFVYVDDAVRATLFFCDHPETAGLFNVGSGVARTWIELADAVYRATGVRPSVSFVKMPKAMRRGYQYHTQADLTKLRAAGYRESFKSIEQGALLYA